MFLHNKRMMYTVRVDAPNPLFAKMLLEQFEGNYLGDLLKGKMPDYVNMSLTSGPTLLGGSGARLTDSMGAPWTAAYIDITYGRLIKVCDDAGLKDTLNFLMSREVAHQKMFEAALDSLPANFPPAPCPAMRS